MLDKKQPERSESKWPKPVDRVKLCVKLQELHSEYNTAFWDAINSGDNHERDVNNEALIVINRVLKIISSLQ